MDLAQTLWQLLTNPNIAYLLLIMGLWAGITALVVPGTGLPETIAAVCLVLGILGLAQLPVNLAGALMIALSFILFLVDLKVTSHGALTLGGIISFAVGSIFLVQPRESQPGISLIVVAATTLATTAFFGLAVSAALRTFRLPVFSSPQQRLIGAQGTVKQAIAPLGEVQVRSELWSAVSDEPLPSGESVVVVGIEGLRLRVARRK